VSEQHLQDRNRPRDDITASHLVPTRANGAAFSPGQVARQAGAARLEVRAIHVSFETGRMR